MYSAPSNGPSYVNVVSVDAFNVTVVWGEITEGQNGVIQKYRIQLNNKDNHYLSHVCCVLVNETRTATFSVLHPGKRYLVNVCGYTSYHKCGTWSNTGWFYSTALCKYGHILYCPF